MTPAQTVDLRKGKKASPAASPAPSAPRTAPPGPAPIIDIDAEEDGIPVRLVGVDYIAHRPKSMLAIRLGEQINQKDVTKDLDALVETMREFVRLMFGSEVADGIMARLEDPDDQLDLPHIQRLVNAMVTVVTGRPPTSPPDSATS
jgi:hypothetical protein